MASLRRSVSLMRVNIAAGEAAKLRRSPSPTRFPMKRVTALHGVRPRRPRGLQRHALALATLFFLLAREAMAGGPQERMPPPLAAPPPPVAATPPPPPGWRLQPGFSIGSGYDSNLYATSSEPEGDLFLLATPSLRLDRAFARGELSFDGQLASARYRDHGGEDSTDYRVSGAGNFRFAPDARLFGGLGVSRSHEDRTSPDDVFGVEPTVYESRQAHLGYAWRGTRWSLRTGATLEQLRFEDVRDIAGNLLRNEDRDRDVLGLGIRIGWALAPYLDAFVQGTFDRRRYRLAVDDAGFDRASRGGQGVLGLAMRGRGPVEGELYAGWLRQRYEDPRLPDVRAPTFGADLGWSLASGTRVSAALERTVYETTLPGASAYVDTSVTLRARRSLDERLRVWAELTAARSDFRGLARNDDVLIPGIGLSYRLGRHAWLDADYHLMRRRSDRPEAQYDRQLFTLSLRYAAQEPAGAADAAATASASAAPAGTGATVGPSGFYVGTGIGRDVFATRVSGVRGGEEEAPGAYLGEFGGRGNAAILLAGYGRPIGRLYLAGELDSASSGSGWDHEKSPDSENFSADAGRELGVTLLVGRVLPTGSVASVFAGRRRARFDSRVVTAEGEAATQEDAVLSTHYGVGLEAPLSPRLFVRARYLVAAYDGYAVPRADSSSDRFSGEVGRFLVETGLRFGARDLGPGPSRARSGLYAGLQGGDDRSGSHMHARMRQSSQPQDTEFDADFGGSGTDAGAFVGLDGHRGALYGGIEVEVDASRAAWRHDRLPNGRRFSIAAESSGGASLRLGFITPSGALLYLRGGRVRGRFRIVYIKGENEDTWIDRDEALAGTRVGLGLEVPLSRHAFLRLDYSSTRYDDLAFATEQARADEVLYRNHQQLARIGLGFRF